MTSATTIILTTLLIISIVSSGCISACVPVTIEAKYPNANKGYADTVIIDGKAYPAYTNVYNRVKVNETYSVQLESNAIVGGTIINSVCSP